MKEVRMYVSQYLIAVADLRGAEGCIPPFLPSHDQEAQKM